MTELASSFKTLASRLQKVESARPLSLAELACCEVNHLLEALGTEDLSVGGAQIRRLHAPAEQIRIQSGRTNLSGLDFDVQITFTALDGDAIAAELKLIFPQERIAKLPGPLSSVPLKKLFLEASVQGPSLIIPVVSVLFGGEIQLLPSPHPPTSITVSQSFSPPGWVLRCADIPIPSPTQIAALFGGVGEGAMSSLPLPPELDKIPGLAITEFLCYLTSDWSVYSLAARVEVKEPKGMTPWEWKPVPRLKLSNLQFAFGLERERAGQDDDEFFDEQGDISKRLGDLTHFSASAGAQLNVLPEGTLKLIPRLTYNNGEWRVQITAELGSLQDLVKLANENAAASLPKVLRELQISDATVELTLDRAGVRSFFFSTRLDDWPIVPGDADKAPPKLAIVRTAIELNVNGSGELTSGFVCGGIRIGGLEISVSANKPDSGGWEFEGYAGASDIFSLNDDGGAATSDSAKGIPFGKFIADLAVSLGVPKRSVEGLESFVINNIHVWFKTDPREFKFTCKGTVNIGTDALACELEIATENNLFKFDGIVTFRGMAFKLHIEAGKSDAKLRAEWKNSEKRTLKDVFAGLQAPDIIPDSVALSVTVDGGESGKTTTLSLDCSFPELLQGTKAGFVLRKAPDKTVAAFGLQAGKLSTSNLGALGSALEPYSIAVDKLMITAANGDAKELTLLGTQGGISEGVLLTGDLKVEQTSSTTPLFSYPFQCRLGGEPRTDTKRLQAAGAPGNEGPANAPSAANKAELKKEDPNNVAMGQTVGPVTFRKVRFESRDKDGKKYVYVLLDASLGAGGFALDLQRFNLNFPLEALTDPNKLAQGLGVGLEGLSITYSQPPLTIAGGFAVTDGELPYVGKVYRGYLLIKAEAFQITVLGQYGEIMVPQPNTIPPRPTGSPTTIKVPSLFLYGMYDGVLGGPAAFYVTGLALGGGYNTRLRLPSIEKVHEFPLVSAATTGTTLTTQELVNVVEASYGDYWLAVGVKFNSFKMAESFALFTVAFGNRLQFALLGLTRLTLPAGATQDLAAVYAELAIRAVLDPEAGVFSIEGLLTENSYVFDKRFRLVGGFAFFVWFGNSKYAGDFVITLGGYHPRFLPPAHYPGVPRVGIAAKLSDALTVTGEAYLAITPSCLMTGLKMTAVFQSGNLSAAFIAYADFLIAWAPFHYDANIGIGLAIVYQSFRTFKLEISANLHLWGPPLSGTATVTMWIFSFTVEFGDTKAAKPAPLKWNTIDALPGFRDSFLPAQLSSIRITDGVVREVERTDKTEKKARFRIVNPHELTIETGSSVPCTNVSTGSECRWPLSSTVCIRPMEAGNVTSDHVVAIKRMHPNGQTPEAVDGKFRRVAWSYSSYPSALWMPYSAADELTTTMLENVPSGVVLRAKATVPEHRLGPFPITSFEDEPLKKNIPWQQSPAMPEATGKKFPAQPPSLLNQICNSLPKRVAGAGTWNPIVVQKMFSEPGTIFEKLPACARLGQI